MTLIRSKVTGRATVVHYEDRPERYLYVDVEIDCPQCGTHQFRIAGHHLRVLARIVAEQIEQFPDLIGEEQGIEVINRLQFTGKPSEEPEKN